MAKCDNLKLYIAQKGKEIANAIGNIPAITFKDATMSLLIEENGFVECSQYMLRDCSNGASFIPNMQICMSGLYTNEITQIVKLLNGHNAIIYAHIAHDYLITLLITVSQSVAAEFTPHLHRFITTGTI